jgi:hypothetical protein
MALQLVDTRKSSPAALVRANLSLLLGLFDLFLLFFDELEALGRSGGAIHLISLPFGHC